MPDKNALRQELEALSPLLAKLQHQPDGLRIPDDYFEQLSVQPLHCQPTSQPIAARRTLPLKRTIYFLTAAVAAAVLLFIGGRWLNQPATECLDPTCLQSLEIQAYINDHIQQFDSYTLLEASIDLQNSYFSESMKEAADFDDALQHAVYTLPPEELEELLQTAY